MEAPFKNDIVIVGQQPWDTEIGSNCKNIALEFSKTNRVLYINSPLDRNTLIKTRNNPKTQLRLDIIRKKENGLIKIKDNLWNYYPDCIVESINWIDNDFLFSIANKYNNYRFSQSIKKALKTLGFDKFILFNDNEIFKAFYLKDYLKPYLGIYYSRDYMIAVDYWKKHGEKLEPLLISKNDLCFANSTYLADYCKQYNPRSYYVGQGCDLHDFQNQENLNRPEDLKKIGNIIGYVGFLSSLRLDIEVIETIALNFPDNSIVLVGPEDEDFKDSNLHNIKNVYFLGQKPIDELPAYVNTFAICVNPQVVNAVTIGNYPRKIDEYLSLGKPTVATSTKTMEVFKEHVYLADTKEDYVRLIKTAIKDNNDALVSERIKFVSTHTWENSVKAMVDQISTFLMDSK